MQINAAVDTGNLQKRLDLTAKNLLYGVVQAINDTAKEIQKRQRAELDKEFVLRKREFMLRTVKIFEFASVRRTAGLAVADGKLYAVVGIDGRKGKLLMPMFETGGVKLPNKGKNIAIPITGGPARPSIQQIVSSEFTFKNLHFKRHVTRNGAVQWKGEKHTFLVPGLGVFQRVPSKTRRRNIAGGGFVGDKGKRLLFNSTHTIMLYDFKKRAPLKKRMNFYLLAQQTYAQYFQRSLTNRSRGKL